MEDLVEFLRARLDAAERAVRDRLCLNCGNRVVPLQSDFGVTGYTHEGGWQGRRCPGRLVGATPVQDPEWVLAEVEAKRRLVELHVITVEKTDVPPFDSYTGERNPDEYNVTCAICGWASDDPTSACLTLRLLALPYATHPEYKESWRP